MVLLCVQGGGLYINGATVTMTSCSVHSNTASVSARLLNLATTFHRPIDGPSDRLFSDTTHSVDRAYVLFAPQTRVCPFNWPIESTPLVFSCLQGGGLFLAGGTTTLTRTLIYGNAAPTGANIQPSGGLLYYALPVPAGHWLPNSDCVANRLPCDPGPPAGDACRNADCHLKSGSAPDWTPTNCKAPIEIQPCDWKTAACTANPPTTDCLLGKKVMFVPYFPVDATFPYPCAPGYLGSNESAFQISSDCAGKCPAGSFCPNASTIEAQVCPAGYYCPEGSSVPRPCPPGRYSASASLQSADECTLCPAGSSCATGSTTHSLCAAGTYNPSAQQETCLLCPAGQYQDAPGSSSCKHASLARTALPAHRQRSSATLAPIKTPLASPAASPAPMATRAAQAPPRQSAALPDPR